MACLWFVVSAATFVSVQGTGFLSETGKYRLDVQAFQHELTEAMGMALGCGGHVGDSELQAIERELQPIWQSLQKDAKNRIERRSLRYLVHRFFDRRSALHVRGFEPSRLINSSGWGDADILSQRVPAYVEAVLESKHRTTTGFDLRDVAIMVATIQQLIFDFEGALLEKAYRRQRQPMTGSLSILEVRQVLATYLVHWFVGDDMESISILLSNSSLLEASIPHWDKLVSMAEGHARALNWKRQTAALTALADGSARPGHNALVQQYSFEDMHSIVGTMTRGFASFWESECQAMKGALVDMDTHHTGRVPLSKFYSSTLDGEWRFGESETYLRELGALDETSWRGKQVIISNYIQGASNCIVSSTHYLVCCVNECEAMQGELEVALGSPLASPQQISDIVEGLAEDPIQSSLRDQLEKIAATHDGLVPLHGRLFAQWLHYVFPHDCPFPHKAGAATKLTPAEFGDQYMVQSEDMIRHAEEANVSDIPVTVGRDELQWMSQWSPEEELVSDQAMQGLHAPWESRRYAAGGVALLLVAGFLGFLRTTSKPSKRADEFKSHFV